MKFSRSLFVTHQVPLLAGERPQVERPELERPELERPQVERPQVERPQVERPQLDRPQLNCPQLDPQADPPRVEPPRVEPPRVEPPRVEPPVQLDAGHDLAHALVQPAAGQGRSELRRGLFARFLVRVAGQAMSCVVC